MILISVGAMAGVHFASILAGLFGTLALGPIRLGFILSQESARLKS
jgi:hypothetical protein